MYPLMTIGLMMGYMYKAPFYARAILFLSSVPISILMNSARIAVVAVLVNHSGIKAAEGFMHYFEGWVIFLICIGLLLLEAKLLNVALKINDKDKLIKKLYEFLLEITNDFEHIFAVIVCSLFIIYALNGIDIDKWIENINKDLNELKGIEIEKYLDSLNNYYELNFRNNNFVEQKIEYVVDRRNYYFIENYCDKNNRILSERPFEQVLLIYDTLIRSKDNWEKLILFGMVNFNDNVSISIIIGCLYEILFSSRKVNKNLIKRFSF
jgi:exosortase/archaeosortase family protein